ncbi:uncharacterized RING finger protein P32A8.03c-like [Lotus japonicus]|uniref:uncharacterized RING finger protein P32A8.03c-like n=1 Tax=Lotus japonicus TaxID=34305 RepID=UPI0025861E88|nr:uncharacterized RING finger protein P32A8.03c-like [Lotus japonicus]
MDSANSGSMQSSSTGADEEYDSRADSSSSLSAFLNHNNHNNHPPPPQPPPPTTTNHVGVGGLFNHHLNAAHHFDPFSNYLDSIQTSPNLDMVWSRSSSAAVRTEPNQSDLSNNQAFLLNQFAAGAATVPGSQQLSMPPENAHQAQSNNSNNNNQVRNPKKRSRASRRAPTTVLTTDTTNFRAMVQEFTGIPAPPFSSSHFPRTRLDLFGASSAASSTPPYLLRPFAQKIKPPPPPPPQPSTNSTNSTSINYLQQQQQQQFPLNMQNNTFQSIVQAPQKYSIGNSSLVSPKTQSSLEIPPATVDSHLKMSVMEGLGLMSHAHVNTQIGSLHQNMVPSSSDEGALLSRINNIHNSSGNWAQRMGANAIANNDGDHHGGVFLGSLGGRSSNIIPEGVPNGGSSPSPSDFHGEKGPERVVAARSEGTVESWINCSSE